MLDVLEEFRLAVRPWFEERAARSLAETLQEAVRPQPASAGDDFPEVARRRRRPALPAA
jgi:hypothetical protein